MERAHPLKDYAAETRRPYHSVYSHSKSNSNRNSNRNRNSNSVEFHIYIYIIYTHALHAPNACTH